MKIVIVGGVAGGATAAARIRRLNEKAEIIIIERSLYISYANCGLPYYIGDVIKNKNELTLQTPKSFWDRFHIDVRTRNEVIQIDTEKKIVIVKNLEDGSIYEETYDKLILSPGAKPVRPSMEGIDNERIFSLRTVKDTLNIKEYIKYNHVKKVTVIGGGFIGIEMAENLSHLGLQVTLVEYANHLLAPLDVDMASIIHNLMNEKGIKLMLNTAVTGFVECDDKIITQTSDGCEIESEVVILSMGVVPETDLAREAGLELGIKGSIVVNEQMETSKKDIYAVGDAVEIKHFVTNQKALISLAGPANKQARIAANNICGINSKYKGAQGSSVIKLFDLTIATTGINEGQAVSLGIDYDKVVLTPASHASYYPGGQSMTMKVIFEKNTLKILGAEIVGYNGVDKRIDVLATAIRANMTGLDLIDLDLAYAPPYSSAKDPVNMAGYMIENLVTEKIKQFHWHDLENLVNRNDVFLLDTRTKEEFDTGHIETFVNVPIDELRENINKIPRDKKIYVMCQSGLRSYIACRILNQNGFDCYNFSGGYAFYAMIKNGYKQPYEVYPCGMEK